MPGCIFAPYFPPEEPQKFASVHKIFGASNVTKLLNDLLPHQREDAVNSLAYEAEDALSTAASEPSPSSRGRSTVSRRSWTPPMPTSSATSSDMLIVISQLMVVSFTPTDVSCLQRILFYCFLNVHDWSRSTSRKEKKQKEGIGD
ncbi:uncharacterized protein A4U43_C01F26760 [Asparagus officinalis]|uniref:LOB domain-containing protein n=1 Tax=Asparagus officinalis TaxID=4686 RepID=A0A5P1FSM7_ASPOF|nr:uncharacterized protein A4U43_C01F26760 [Asparagus officinalis]